MAGARRRRAGCSLSGMDVGPRPGDSWARAEYAFLLRDSNGSVRAVHETHRLGLFGSEQWLRLLADAGFDPRAVSEVTSEDRAGREFFVGHRPGR